MTIDQFEQTLVETALEEDTPVNNAIKKQYNEATRLERKMGPFGFITTLEIPDGLKYSELSTQIANTMAQYPDKYDACYLVIHIVDGFIDYLECYTIGDRWPDQYGDAEIKSLTAIA